MFYNGPEVEARQVYKEFSDIGKWIKVSLFITHIYAPTTSRSNCRFTKRNAVRRLEPISRRYTIVTESSGLSPAIGRLAA